MTFRTAVLAILGVVVLCAGIAAVVAVTSLPTVTSGRTRLTYRQVSLVVPKGWAVTREPTCSSQATVLVLYTPSIGLRRDTISVGEVPHADKQTSLCPVASRVLQVKVKVKWEYVAIHGLRLKALDGRGFFNGTIPALKLTISANGPDAIKVIHTLQRK